MAACAAAALSQDKVRVDTKQGLEENILHESGSVNISLYLHYIWSLLLETTKLRSSYGDFRFGK